MAAYVYVQQPDGQIALAADPAQLRKDEEELAARPPPPGAHPDRAAHAARPAAFPPARPSPEAMAAFQRWGMLYRRQQVCYYVAMTMSMVYLLALLIVRFVYSGKYDQDYEVTGVAAFFLSKQPQDVSVPFIAAGAIADLIGGLAVWHELIHALTLMAVWSFILCVFSAGQMPAFFTISRAVVLVATLELRTSLGRLLHLMPPFSLVLLPFMLIWQLGEELLRPFKAYLSRRRNRSSPPQQQPAAAEPQIVPGLTPAPPPVDDIEMAGQASTPTLAAELPEETASQRPAVQH